MDNQFGIGNQTANLSSLSSAWNNTQQALVYTLTFTDNASFEGDGEDAHRVRLLALNQFASPAALVTAVLLVFLFSPTIIIGNSLVLIAIYRFKRLRTPSNYLVMSLATSDLGVGMYTPIGMYLELCGVSSTSTSTSVSSGAALCLLNYGVPITLCCVSVLVMVAIAVDRFTSLARPLRYNNLITHTAMERYIAVFWIYAALVGFSPFTYHMFYGSPNYQSSHCSFGSLIPRPIQLFMFCAVYGPSAFILLVCYGYIYLVARGHARAISEVRHSLQYGHGTNAPRYGLALAITTGMFLTLWLPFQICMLLDVFTDSKILTQWIVIYLALPIVSSSAFNPWIYGYRNGELRLAVQKVVDDMLTLLGFNYRSHPISDAHVVPPSIAATAGDAGSFIHCNCNCNCNCTCNCNCHHHHQHNKHSVHRVCDPLAPEIIGCAGIKQPPIKREYYSWNPDDEYLLVPIAKPESSGFLSLDDEKYSKFSNSAKNLSLNFNLINNNNQLNNSGRSLNLNFGKTKDKKGAKNSKGRKRCGKRNIGSHLNFNFVKDIKDFKALKNKDTNKNQEQSEVRDVEDDKTINHSGDECHRDIKMDIRVHSEMNGLNGLCKDLCGKEVNHNKIMNCCAGCQRPGLKGSKSMIESFAGLRNGTDVWIFKGKNLVINGASIV